MQVSFLIPLYNNLPLTQAMFASLRATVPAGLKHEIIFVDDGSTDGTRAWLETLRTDSAIRIVLNERNLGYAAANNRGAAIAQGDLLVLLNNDLVLAPGWLEPMLAAHASLGAKAGLVGNVQRDARTRLIDHSGIVIDHKGKPAHLRTLPRFPLSATRRVVAATGACLLLARTLWQELGGFDERYVNGCEDVDLCLRARALGRVNAIALRSVIVHHVSSSLGRKARDEQNTFRLTQRWHDELARLGARAWCRDFVAARMEDPRDFSDPAFACAAVLYSVGLLNTPPSAALEGMRTALDRELTRWRSLA